VAGEIVMVRRSALSRSLALFSGFPLWFNDETLAEAIARFNDYNLARASPRSISRRTAGARCCAVIRPWAN